MLGPECQFAFNDKLGLKCSYRKHKGCLCLCLNQRDFGILGPIFYKGLEVTYWKNSLLLLLLNMIAIYLGTSLYPN